MYKICLKWLQSIVFCDFVLSDSYNHHLTVFSMIHIACIFYLSIDLEIRDNNGHVPLWMAILSSDKPLQEEAADNPGFASRLVDRGSSPDAVNHLTGLMSMYFLLIF